MNRKTQIAIGKFKDAGGAYLWQPPEKIQGSPTMSANLTAQPIDQLLEQFLAIALAQDLAERKSKYAQYNRLYGRMDEVRAELKRRPSDARRELIRFFQHPNAQVRLKAAISCLAIFPDEARRVLQDLFAGGWFPQAAEAKGILMSMDAGRYVPD